MIDGSDACDDCPHTERGEDWSAAPLACTCPRGTVNAGYVSGIGSSKEYVGPINVRLRDDPACPKHGERNEGASDV